MTATATDFMEEVVAELKHLVAAEFQARFDAFARSVDDRIKALATVKGEKGDAGRDGEPGKSIEPQEVLTMLKGLVESMPKPRDGVDGKSVSLDDVRGLAELSVKAIPVPRDGKDGRDAPPVDMGLLAKQAAALVPAGKDGKDADADEIAEKVLGKVMKALDAVPAAKDGRDGINGKDGAPGERGADGKDGAAGADGRDGKDGAPGLPGQDGRPGDKGETGQVGENGQPGDRGEKGDAGVHGKDGAPGINGKDGAPGMNGKDGADGLNGKDGSNGMNGKDGSPGADGQKGIDGRDGTSVTLEDMRPVLEGHVDKWALDFERRAGDVLQKAIDRMPVAKDGKDGSQGRDGADAIGFDDVRAEKTGDRTIAIVFEKDGRQKRFEFDFPVALDAGVYKSGETYEAGDCLTYGGSMFIAQRSTRPTEKPEDGSGAFRLAVKRGRDGGTP